MHTCQPKQSLSQVLFLVWLLLDAELGYHAGYRAAIPSVLQASVPENSMCAGSMGHGGVSERQWLGPQVIQASQYGSQVRHPKKARQGEGLAPDFVWADRCVSVGSSSTSGLLPMSLQSPVSNTVCTCRHLRPWLCAGPHGKPMSPAPHPAGLFALSFSSEYVLVFAGTKRQWQNLSPVCAGRPDAPVSPASVCSSRSRHALRLCGQ